MENVNNKSVAKAVSTKPVRKNAPTLASSRWASRSSQPRLVSFSWAAVAPTNSQR